jgi:hypothetical protein
MENNVQGNTAARDSHEQGPTFRDWREERRQWRRDMREQRRGWPFHGLFCGLTLVLLGVLFLLNQAGTITGDTWWQSLLIGLGVIWVFSGMVRSRHPVFRWGAFGRVVGGIILILVGALLMAGVSQWWPVVLIVAGVAFLLRFFWRWQSVIS